MLHKPDSASAMLMHKIYMFSDISQYIIQTMMYFIWKVDLRSSWHFTGIQSAKVQSGRCMDLGSCERPVRAVLMKSYSTYVR